MSDMAEKDLAQPQQSTGRARATLEQIRAMRGEVEVILTDTAMRPLLVRRRMEHLKEVWKLVEGTKHFELLGQ